MRLRRDWKRILKRAWSVRFMFLGAGLTGLAGVWFALEDYTPIWLFIAGGVVVPIMAVGARLISQKDLRDE